MMSKWCNEDSPKPVLMKKQRYTYISDCPRMNTFSFSMNCSFEDIGHPKQKFIHHLLTLVPDLFNRKIPRNFYFYIFWPIQWNWSGGDRFLLLPLQKCLDTYDHMWMLNLNVNTHYFTLNTYSNKQCTVVLQHWNKQCFASMPIKSLFTSCISKHTFPISTSLSLVSP